MSRIPLSWVSSLLDTPVQVDLADLVLGELGVTVSAVTGLGAACRDVVVGEVLSGPGEQLRIAVATPERVALPSGVQHVPDRGTKVAVALPGALVMRAADGDAEGPFGTFRAVTTGNGDSVRVGRVCTEADLSDGGSPALAVLPQDAVAGAPVREWLPRGWGDDMLSVRLAPGAQVAGRVAELADELVRRGVAGRSTPPAWPLTRAPGRLVVDVPGVTAAAVRIHEPGPHVVVPAGDRRRHRSVGIPTEPSAVDEYLAAAAFETGLRLERRRSTGGVPQIVLTGTHERVRVDLAEPGPAAPVTGSWILVAWGPSTRTGVEGCRRALLRVCAWLDTRPGQGWDGVGAEVALLAGSMDPSRFEAVTGIRPTVADVEAVLRPAGIRLTADGPDSMTVQIPRSRADLVDEEALVEEVVRRTGLSRLPGVVTQAEASRDHADRSRSERVVRRRLQAAGWTELVTPMVVPAVGTSHADSRLLASADAVRTSVLPGLLAEAGLPGRSGRIFEIGSVWTPGRTTERRVLGLVQEVDPAPGDVMRLLRLLTRTLHGPDLDLGPRPIRDLDQWEWRLLRAGGGDVGRIGLGPANGRTITVAAEIELTPPGSRRPCSPTEPRAASGPRRPMARTSVHPAATRDLTVLLPPDLSAGGFCERVVASEPLVADIAVVDRYREPTSGAVWLTFRLSLASRWRTVPRLEAHDLVGRVVRRCAVWGVDLRGPSSPDVTTTRPSSDRPGAAVEGVDGA